jgi:hypothetical protein
MEPITCQSLRIISCIAYTSEILFIPRSNLNCLIQQALYTQNPSFLTDLYIRKSYRRTTSLVSIQSAKVRQYHIKLLRLNKSHVYKQSNCTAIYSAYTLGFFRDTEESFIILQLRLPYFFNPNIELFIRVVCKRCRTLAW